MLDFFVITISDCSIVQPVTASSVDLVLWDTGARSSSFSHNKHEDVIERAALTKDSLSVLG